jgi:hypothetical protein
MGIVLLKYKPERIGDTLQVVHIITTVYNKILRSSLCCGPVSVVAKSLSKSV